MRVKGVALAVAILAGHCCQAQQGSRSSSKTGSDAGGHFWRDELALPDRRTLDTGGWNDTNFEMWGISSSPTDWFLARAKNSGGEGTAKAEREAGV